MTDRERLIELMQKCDIVQIPTSKFIEGLADYLLEHGVIVLPCKVGDTVYLISFNEITSCTVTSIDYNSWGIPTKLFLEKSEYNGFGIFSMQCTDETIFLTREEAEKALKERDGS